MLAERCLTVWALPCTLVPWPFGYRGNFPQLLGTTLHQLLHRTGFDTAKISGNQLKVSMGEASSLRGQQGLFAVCHQFLVVPCQTSSGVGDGYEAVPGLADGVRKQGHCCGVGRNA